jgi:hypothetical protein
VGDKGATGDTGPTGVTGATGSAGAGKYDGITLGLNVNGSLEVKNQKLAEAYGGTNQATYTTGDILYASAANTLSKLTVGAAGNSLVSRGGIPSWESLSGRHRSLVVLGADVANSTTSLADVTGLSFNVVAGTTYKFYALVAYASAATTTGSRWTINGPTTSLLAYSSSYSLTATSNTFNTATAYSIPAAANASSATTTGNVAVIEGMITPSANGTVQVRFASEVAGSAITAKAGSTLEWWTTY